jgi:molybdate transport system substrate-binding protein
MTTLVSCTSSAPTDQGEDQAPPADIAAEPVTLNVSAAASLTDALNEIIELYKPVATNVTVTPNYGSSGALQTQIEEGASVDVFLSAAQTQMDTLEGKSLIATGTRKNLLENKVVLITPKGATPEVTDFAGLNSEAVTKIAIGDPASVPVGQYAQEAFTSLGIWDAISAKANLGTDVRQVLTWVETGESDYGVVYATDASVSDKVTVISEAPAGSHKPVVYPGAVIAASTNQEAAKAFLDFLSGSQASEVFVKYGFALAS